MSTAPWNERAPDALRGDVFHTGTVQVIPSTGDPITLDVESVQVTFDDGWTPHIQATITCRVPDDQDTLDRIDPRTGTRVLIQAGYSYQDGRDDTHDLALLHLRSRPVRRPGNTIELVAHSGECRLLDNAPLGSTHNYTTSNGVIATIADILSWSLGETLSVDMSSGDLLDAAMSITTGTDLWRTVKDLADRIGGRLYVDGAGTWHLDQWPTKAAQSAYVMRTGPQGNLEETEATLSIDEWGNAVLLDYGSNTYGWATVTGGPFSVSSVPRKVVRVSRTDVAPGSQSARNAVAGSVLGRIVSRGRGFTLKGPAAYWIRPGQTVTAKLPTGPQERHLVSRVTFELLTGTMSIQTRVPDNDTVITIGA